MITESNNHADDGIQHHPRVGCSRMARTCWLLTGILVGVAAGFIAGTEIDGLKRPWRTAPAAKADGIGGEDASELAGKYQEEVVRLAQRRQQDATALVEKDLTLQEMKRRDVDPNSPSCRRLRREVDELGTAIVEADGRLGRLREQLANLTAVRNAEGRRDDGFDPQIEVSARRFVLEHNAGLSHK